MKEKSWEQNRDAPLFNREVSNFLARQYSESCISLPCSKTNQCSEHVNLKPDDPLRSPFLFATGDVNLPLAYFAIAGADIWRVSGSIYEQVLREECGVKTKVDIFPGLPHGFWTMFPAAGFSKEFRSKFDEGLKLLFHQCG